MPEGLFAAPLEILRVPDHVGLPPGFRHEQVRLPARAGVDAAAAAVQIDGPMGPDVEVRIAGAVATWCGEDQGQLDVRRGSLSMMRSQGAGDALLDVEDLGIVAAELLDDPACPLRRVAGDEPLLWCAARRYRADSPPEHGVVPYGQVPVRFLQRHPDQPLRHPTNHSGLGAGADEAGAVEAACTALLIEDALVRWWRDAPSGSGRDFAEITDADVSQGRVAFATRAVPDAAGGAVAVALAASWPAPGEPPVVTLGGGMDSDRAVARALWQHVIARTLSADPTRFAGGRPAGLLPHREDRRYLDDRRALRAGVDPLASLQVGLDPRCVERVLAAFHGLMPVRYGPRRPVLAQLTLAGHEVWIVDLTTPDVRPTGWRCVRALAPGLSRVAVPSFDVNATAPPYPGW